MQAQLCSCTQSYGCMQVQEQPAASSPEDLSALETSEMCAALQQAGEHGLVAATCTMQSRSLTMKERKGKVGRDKIACAGAGAATSQQP